MPKFGNRIVSHPHISETEDNVALISISLSATQSPNSLLHWPSIHQNTWAASPF